MWRWSTRRAFQTDVIHAYRLQVVGAKQKQKREGGHASPTTHQSLATASESDWCALPCMRNLNRCEGNQLCRTRCVT